MSRWRKVAVYAAIMLSSTFLVAWQLGAWLLERPVQYSGPAPVRCGLDMDSKHAAIVRLGLSGYSRPTATSAQTEDTMARFWTRKRARYDKSYFRMVGMALLPALGVGITTQVVGGMLGGSESLVDRLSQIVSFPTFLGACHYIRARQTPTTT